MRRKSKKGFTLIELIGVLVIMSVIALIVTPLVMNIIRSARVAADKRSIDAYGRSIEHAIAAYLLDNGRFPTDISQLNIEYSGSKVVCSIAKLNSDSSVYLSGCTVNGRNVDYFYGVDENAKSMNFTFGSMVMYGGEEYYVLEDSTENDNNVKLLKVKPLSTNTVNNILESLNIDYQATDSDGIGLVKFGSDNDYAKSDIKKVLDSWIQSKNDSQNVIDARLITEEELNSLGYEYKLINPTQSFYTNGESTPDWVYANSYWSSSAINDSSNKIYEVNTNGRLETLYVNNTSSIRPVIEINKKSNILSAIDYNIGDLITYNGVDYYVIKNSTEIDTSVTLLKKEPLTVDEVNLYGGVGTENNHVNMYNTYSSDSYYRTAYNSNGYGGMAYYTSETCGYVNNNYISTGCTRDYASSEVKYVVDAWKNEQAPSALEARLITLDDITDKLGIKIIRSLSNEYRVSRENTPIWLYVVKPGYYWTSSVDCVNTDTNCGVWNIQGLESGSNDRLNLDSINDPHALVRPVIVLSKSVLSK